MSTIIRQTLDDLARASGKAELVDGRVIEYMGSDYIHGLIALLIARSLQDYQWIVRSGFALGDGVSFVVPELSTGRESYMPDVSYTLGRRPAAGFVQGPPTFAVEVRTEGDYGRTAERDMATKRAEYFGAGTLVVWDADPLHRTITKHANGTATFRTGDVADAEPAVPGWRLAVDDLFRHLDDPAA